MVCDASLPGALFGIFNPGAQISTAGAEFMPPGAQYRSQRRNTGAPKGLDFLIMLAGSRPQGWTCQVMDCSILAFY